MMKQYRHLEELSSGYEQRGTAIRKRLREYRRVTPNQYFYELIYCLMTPQSSAVNAAKAQTMFEMNEFKDHDLDPEPILRNKESYIRFHKTKAQWIVEMKSGYDRIFATISSSSSAEEKRAWLVDNVKGLSYKEATHFLRNIGKNEGLAILDRHILKNLKYHGVIRSIPPTLTRKRYMAIERLFRKFSQAIGISLDELDLLFWSTETGEILK